MNQGERRLCEFQYGMSGGFTEKLFRAIFHADGDNQFKLKKGFPEEVEAVERFQTESGYWEKLDHEFKSGIGIVK